MTMETAVTPDEMAALRRRVDALEAQHDTPLDTHMLVRAMTDSPGLVSDEGLARATPCNCFALGDGAEECFSKGIVGGLDEGQKALFCNPRVTREPTPAQKAHLEIWRSCGDEVKVLPKGERLSPFYSCIEREQRARGITEPAYGS